MPRNIRDEIVEKRRARVARLGHTEGAGMPAARDVPLVPFLGADGLICEIKRRSPSKGDIAAGLDAVAQAGRYAQAGATNLSVLTEPEGFGGALADLIQVKRAFPRVAVLRKDFLFDLEDIDVSFRAGADAVLLIAGMLSGERLAAMHARARALGLRALVELHDRDDLAKAAAFAPDLVGMNSRDLTTFQIDPLLPLVVAAGVNWSATRVYESGVTHPEQAAFAAAAGFGGLLVGEAVVRSPDLTARLKAALRTSRRDRFWTAVSRRRLNYPDRPLVKICGLTNERDAQLAVENGADILGFVFWHGSSRQAAPDLLRKIGKIAIPKVGVAVSEAGSPLAPEIRALLADGYLDAVQLHGQETPDDGAALGESYYRALRPACATDLAEADGFRCPRLLLDAAADLPGGTGKRVNAAILAEWRRPLWLAGGINPDNVRGIIEQYRPELIDLASGVEAAPGRKDAEKLKRLFREVQS
ncbi:MAG: bifunctional indole-3-glycerol phosphate synthase/phosphoribosylanthranilate isomerase [Planctomycetota bacterium]|jgi:indole-3-glycerol phosphate synthase/phosphoribosylanthranilate isomerase|nr:bifunctional indole-3-glycerol phosphate synthase/phosphoribosylanthranilate isomerase [Planctomycetota bacterium]